MNQYGWHNHLQGSELFNTLSNAELKQIWPLCTHRTCDEDEIIHNQGEHSDALYVIADGAVTLLRHVREPDMTENGEVAIDILQASRVFGWSSLIRPSVHTATAKAVGKTELIAIDAAALKFTLENNPSAGFKVMLKLTQLLVSRLREAYSVFDAIL